MQAEADRLIERLPSLLSCRRTPNESALSEKYWRAVNANGQSASPPWTSSSTTSSALDETIRHGRCQPMPCSEWGESETLAAVV